MSSLAWKDFILQWIMRIVFSQVYIVVALGTATICLMIFRKVRLNRLEKFKNHYAELFINELLSLADEKPEAALERPPSYNVLGVLALQDTLLAQINTLSGSEKAYAVKRYVELGYAKDDIDLCISLRWWKRLEGISHLNALKDPSFARVFNYMRKDENKLISLYSLLGLSSLQHPFNTPKLFDTLSEVVKGQDNILLEITHNWSNIFGLTSLVQYVDETNSFEFRNTFVAAICQMKTPQAAQVISDFLQQDSRFFPAELIAEMIHAIREVGDPSLGVEMKKYLQHDDEQVRQRALEFMTTVNGEIPPESVSLLEADPSPGVQRIYQQWVQEKAA